MISESTYSDGDPAEENTQAILESTPFVGSDDPVGSEKQGNDKVVLHGVEPASNHVKVVLSQRALRQIEGHGASDLMRELGGVLLGHATQSSSSTRAYVAAALPVRSEDHGPVHFTFNADTWAQLHQDRAERYPRLDVVGWYHTHPDLGAFYSADDIVVHSAAFVLPWQVGMVVDPVRNENCLVGWIGSQVGDKDRDLAGLPGYYEQLDQQNISVVSWHFIRASIWRQGGYLPPQTQNNRVYAPASDWPELPKISPWWGAILGGISLLISLILLLERLLGGA